MREMGHAFIVICVLSLVLLSSGCTQNQGTGENATEYTYYNMSGNESIPVPKGDFAFKVHGENEVWLKPNRSARFYVVFNNADDDGEAHDFIARMYPSVVDFYVMAAYKCQHFTTCAPLIRDMNDFIQQPLVTQRINHTSVGLSTMDVTIPEDAVKGTYMYNTVACQDMEFSECHETAANWGPNIPIIVHVI